MSSSVLNLKAVPENLEEVITFITEGAEGSFLSSERLMGLSLAVEEVFINICTYAFPAGDGRVEITCSLAEGSYVVKIVDSGLAFDPLSLPDPDISLSIEERSIGGLGVCLVRHLTDKAEYFRENSKNILCLTLYRQNRKEDA